MLIVAKFLLSVLEMFIFMLASIVIHLREVFINLLVSFIDVHPHRLFTFSVIVFFSELGQAFGGSLVFKDGNSLFAEFVSPGLEFGTS